MKCLMNKYTLIELNTKSGTKNIICQLLAPRQTISLENGKRLQPFPQTFATALANVCNRLRKRLHPKPQKIPSLVHPDKSVRMTPFGSPPLPVGQYLRGLFSFNTDFSSQTLAHPNKCLTFAPSVLAKPLNNAQIVRGVFYL